MNEGEIRRRLAYWLERYYVRRAEFPHAYYRAFDYHAGIMVAHLHMLDVDVEIRQLKRKTLWFTTETYPEPTILSVVRIVRAVLGMEEKE